eukprot:TRINITY_DN1334_c0_g1_i7.p1 TRINITY_DN1334_c0_g1~~TRINITY_DN1334_c0_g1_i7.p1  ORF type:complete len:296 (+),score=66.34 TRINITY_DN1334_c0_g1_i7:27-890(+)
MSDDHIEVEGEGDHLEIEASNTTEVNTNQDTIGVDDNDDLDEDDQGGDHIQVDEDDQQNDKKDDNEDESSDAKKEIYTFKAPWTIYGMGWSVQNSEDFRIAIGSFIEDYTNKVDVMELKDEEFVKVGSFDHPYPTTKIMWNPDKNGVDLIGTTGDYMRLWKVSEDGNIKKELVMNNNKNTDFCAPLTSFDWSTTATNVIGTASIDTTCTIWDIEAKAPIRQLIAHDREVFGKYRTEDDGITHISLHPLGCLNTHGSCWFVGNHRYRVPTSERTHFCILFWGWIIAAV